MKICWTRLFFAAVFCFGGVCSAQAERPQWDNAGDQTYCDEEYEGEATAQQCYHHNHNIFFSPHFYDKNYDKGYQEPVPAPDWPGANDLLLDQLSR